MKIRLIFILFVLISCPAVSQTFTMEEIGKFTFPSELTADQSGTQLAWAMYKQGKRNVYYAEAPRFEPQKLTAFDKDDGQEITGLHFSNDGNWLVFVRGGDHGGYLYSSTVNADNLPTPPKVEIWKINLTTQAASIIGEGDDLVMGPDSKLAFLKSGKIWTIDLENGLEPSPLFDIKGTVNSMEYSPDGKSIAFTVNRGGHQLIGIYRDADTPIQFISPSFHRYSQPKWSPDGSKIAFIKTLGGTGAAFPLLEPRHAPWEIWHADVASGEAEMLWKAPETLRGSHRYFFFSYPNENELVFESYHDGWQHLYALDIENKKRNRCSLPVITWWSKSNSVQIEAESSSLPMMVLKKKIKTEDTSVRWI